MFGREAGLELGEEEFKRVFTQYLSPESRLVAEVAIGNHRLLVWELRPAPRAPSHLAGQYFMEIEGRYLVDDLPGAMLDALDGERSDLADLDPGAFGKARGLAPESQWEGRAGFLAGEGNGDNGP